MCSLAGEVMIQENPGMLTGKGFYTGKCIKCLTEKPAILLRKKDAYCKPCFLQVTTHKFRAAIGKYRISKDERVLILYRVGHVSSALLHFIKTGLEQSQHKKLRLEPLFLYIDDHYKLSTEERLKLCKQVMEEITSYKFSVYFSVFHHVRNHSWQYIKFTDDSQTEEIENMLKSSRSKFDANKHDLNILRRNILTHIAKNLNCTYAFTTETNGDVAVKMLTSVATGRGLQLALEVGECDDRDPEVKIIQPLRYFEMKELAFYNIFNSITPTVIPTHNYNEMHSSNISKLLSKFVFGLQVNYPSTINTIVRTGDKLASEKTGIICTVCKGPVETQEELSSSEASKFSHCVSVNASHLRDQDMNSFFIERNNWLCYACQRYQVLL